MREATEPERLAAKPHEREKRVGSSEALAEGRRRNLVLEAVLSALALGVKCTK